MTLGGLALSIMRGLTCVNSVNQRGKRVDD